jgi:hypothetical protein
MFFRLTRAVRGYQLGYRENIRIEVGGPRAYIVVLRHEPGEGSAPGHAFLEVTGDFTPPRKPAEAFRDLTQGLLPADSSPGDDLASMIEERRLPTSGRGLIFSELPNSLRVFIREVTHGLATTAASIFELIRWRKAMEGPVDALSMRRIEGIEWCDDAGDWRQLPADVTFRAGRARVLVTSPAEEVASLEAMAVSGIREPVAHAVLRQAQRAAGGREYASALVMAIAALEICVKQLISALIPEAEWLALHAPTPPVVDILREYLPTIPADESIGGNVASPPAEILETLKKAISVRNVNVHRGQRELSPDFIARVLDAVTDVLWMCDYFTGQKWAFRNMSEQMQNALSSPSAGPVLAGAETAPSAESGKTAPTSE